MMMPSLFFPTSQFHLTSVHMHTIDNPHFHTKYKLYARIAIMKKKKTAKDDTVIATNNICVVLLLVIYSIWQIQ